MLYSRYLIASIVCLLGTQLFAEVTVPSIFGDRMVLQREQANPVWGWAEAGEQVKVRIDGQILEATADAQGEWRVELAPLPVGGPYELTIEGTNTLHFEDVLVGEVWICSGQSNMEWALQNSNHAEVEIASAHYPEIRLISVPRVGTDQPQKDFDGQWAPCSPETVGGFSAVGYLFGRRLHNALDVPVGLIDNAWGGSSAEAWVPRETLESEEQYTELLDHWDVLVAAYSDDIHAEKIAEYRAWEDAGKPDPWMRWPKDPRTGNHRPANIFNGVLHPTVGYGIRGVIWYQGEANASRAYQYRDLFPLMIRTWRELWEQGDFPFYWVQLADFREESDSPKESAWAELREAQTMALELPNTGQAVIIDSGEGRDIHPRDKQTVANRLARIALARDYGYDMAYQSPQFASMEIEGDTVTLTFDHVSDGGLRSFDTKEVRGFTIAGEDRKFVRAEAEIVGKDTIRLRSEAVDAPVAVRYAWADNPVANVQDRNGLPLTPFRTDDWPGVTVDKTK